MAEKPEQINKFLASLPDKGKGVDTSLLEYPLAVLIQSGQVFSVNKFNLQCDSNKLTAETIYVNVCGKYRDMNVMASRTLLVNPEDSQKKAYLIANEALDLAIKALTEGEPIKNAYIQARDFIRGKDPALGAKIFNNFGFGVSIYLVEIMCLDWQRHQGGPPCD